MCRKKTLRAYNVTKSIVKEVFFGFCGFGRRVQSDLCVPLKKSWLRPCGCNSVQGNVLGGTISITLEGQHALIVIT